MASASYTEDWNCSICVTFFTDPVVLLCGHSFCRECINLSLSSQRQCPQCRADVPETGKCLPTNHSLKSLVEKEVDKLRREHEHVKEVDEWLCHEHEERLKLFCVTDQQLVCIICRDGEKHQGHKFTPVKEAAAPLREKLEAYMQGIADDVNATARLANTQREEIAKTKDKAQQLTTQISTQFKEMHQFLWKREDEIKNDLKLKEENALEEMSDTLNTMETALTESRVLEENVPCVLEITDSERFIKSWTENKGEGTLEHLFRPRANELKVVNDSLTLGPYESHLQFFMWKEMLQVVQPRAELLSLRSGIQNITVSNDGRNLMYSPIIIKEPRCGNKPVQNTSSYYSNVHYPVVNVSCREDTSVRVASAFSSNDFTSGQHYWELEVGERDYWKVGLENYYLSYNQNNYVTSDHTQLTLTGRPQKIGIYLDCLSKKLSFYDAENMTHIYTMSTSVPAKAYFEYKFSQGADHNPLRVCWF
ncbi:zinc-binding protein A33-like [Hippoglossus stenolepis]|uniref:zinc-binding protein A33-like n=1 Tax=Hippoglossus stenolepis TaxID=195615 RepID=UPI001FAF0B76|nr:zinc-binding protein A33-like [Hippoglossus stenolepis]